MIIVRNPSGLGNKLKNIVTALRIADIEKDYVSLDFDNSNFFNVKQRVEPGDSKPITKIISTWSLELFEQEINSGFLIKDRVLKIFHDEHLTFDLKNSIDFQYDNVRPELKKTFISYFKRVSFHPNILEAVSRATDKINFQDFIGVHIRSWEDSPSRHKNLHRLENFTKLMQDQTKYFYLATDSELVDNVIKEQFKDRVITSKKIGARHISENKSEGALFMSIFDMLILSKCPKIIGTYSSTFTECAWWLSDCVSSVQIADTYPKCL